MNSLKTRLAVAATLAALSLPALASDDPMSPQVGNEAPAMTLGVRSDASTLAGDPTFPEVAALAPSAQLRTYASDEPAFDLEEGTPSFHVALIPEVAAPASTDRLAAH